MRLVPRESDIQAVIVEYFRLKYGIMLDHIDAGASGMRRGKPKGEGGYSGIPKGFPDLLGAIQPNGTMLAIEVKRPGKKPTEDQKLFLDRRRSEGAIAFWADSLDSAIEQYEAAIRGRVA